jgi:hypothetical protein
MKRSFFLSASLLAVLPVSLGLVNANGAPASSGKPRRVVCLDGSWEVAEGWFRPWAPAVFDHAVPVPGLVDMARPPLVEVGTPKSTEHREAFWYRRTYLITGPVPAVARLKIHKACYNTAVYLNGAFVGDHLPCFTPVVYDVRRHLRADSPNELAIRVGAYRNWIPPTVPNGRDGERKCYIRAPTGQPATTSWTLRSFPWNPSSGPTCAMPLRRLV